MRKFDSLEREIFGSFEREKFDSLERENFDIMKEKIEIMKDKNLTV
jgi:hypothetical protein